MNETAFAEAVAQARRKLQPRVASDRSLAALAAAAFFACSALVFCAAAVLAPANVTLPSARSGVN